MDWARILAYVTGTVDQKPMPYLPYGRPAFARTSEPA
jgi:hypothetical protein